MLKQPGGQKGGRVHWFLWWLNKEIRNLYQITYYYPEHKYLLMRYFNKKVVAVMIVIRTSNSAFRVTYFNVVTKRSFYQSFNSAKKCALWVNDFVIREYEDEFRALEFENQIDIFSKRLRFLLHYHRRTQLELARFIGVSQQTVSKWVHKDYLPSKEKIIKIAEFFGVKEIYFNEVIN